MSNSISSSNHISTSCNYVSKETIADTATICSSCSTQLIKFENTGLRLIDVDFLVGELTGTVNTSITEQKKKILFQTKIGFVLGQKQRPVEVIHRIKDINFIAVRHHIIPRTTEQYEYMTVETFEKCYMPLVKRAIQQMNEKGYLVEGDADKFVNVNTHHHNPGPTEFPLSFVQKHGMELQRVENVVAFYTIGGHPDFAIAHLFKHIYSKILALERAKKSDSLFVYTKEII